MGIQKYIFAGFFLSQGFALECPAGSYNNGTLNDTCIECLAGQYNPTVGQTQCWDCAPGSSSNSSASDCYTCDGGKYAANAGASVCKECKAGKFSSNGATSCTECMVGYYEPNNGSSVCLWCPDNFMTGRGATYCDQAINGFYVLERSTDIEDCPLDAICDGVRIVQECPPNALCAGGFQLPIPKKGYWSDRSDAEFLTFPYQCKRETCLVNTTNSECWTQSLIDSEASSSSSSMCDNDALLCTQGAVGPLCGSCKKGYAYSSTQIICIECTYASVFFFMIIIIIILFFLIFIIVLFHNKYLIIPKSFKKLRIYLFFKHIEHGTLKIIFSTYQIIQSVTYSMDVKYPSPFSNFLKGIQFLNFEITGFECTGFSIYEKVIIISISPLLISFIGFLLIEIRLFIINYKYHKYHDVQKNKLKNEIQKKNFKKLNHDIIKNNTNNFIQELKINEEVVFENDNNNNINNDNNDNDNINSDNINNENNENTDNDNIIYNKEYHRIRLIEIKSQRMYYLLLLSYLVLPPTTAIQFQMFDCFKLGKTNLNEFLSMDTSIQCNSKKHKKFIIIVCIFIFLYLSIPMIWIILLFKKKKKLFPLGVFDEKSIITIRLNDLSLKPYFFLFDCYQTKFVYWESIEMFRRILFISIIPLLAISTLRRASIGLGLSLIAMIVYREIMPFCDNMINMLAYIAQIVIFLTYAGSLTLETDIAKNLNPLLLGLLLCCINLIILIIAFLTAYFRSKNEQNLMILKSLKSLKKIEYAIGFSANKFTTTFDTVIENSVPPSHCLAFYFSSLSDIQQVVKSGIPVRKLITNHQTRASTRASAIRNSHQEKMKFRKSVMKPHLNQKEEEMVAYDNDYNDDDDGQFNEGIVFTLHHPHELTEEEKNIFKNREAFVVCALPRQLLRPFIDTSYLNHQNKRTNGQSDASGSKSSLFLLQSKLLIALRGTFFHEVPDASPWYDGVLLLPPTCIKRAYQLISNENITKNESNRTSSKKSVLKYYEKKGSIFEFDLQNKRQRKRTSTHQWTHQQHSNHDQYHQYDDKNDTSMNHNDPISSSSSTFSSSAMIKTQSFEEFSGVVLINNLIENDILPYEPKSCLDFIEKMNYIRNQCSFLGLVPLYHYTMPVMAPLILETGLRMSTQGQGDGGVYFSTLGPCSYNLGSPKYEENLIIDCFGKERLEEYKGKHKLDLVFIYGIEPWILEQAPGGRENAKVVSKSIFEVFSLPHENGNFYLRKDRIFGVFLIDSYSNVSLLLEKSSKQVLNNTNSNSNLNLNLLNIKNKFMEEQLKDIKIKEYLSKIEEIKEKNEILVKTVTQVYDHLIKLEWGCNYNASAFSMIFSEIEFSLSSSSCLAYHYQSHHKINQILRSGLPIDLNMDMNGIVFTLNKPDDLTFKEKNIFTKREAFVACSLPKRLLYPYHKNNQNLEKEQEEDEENKRSQLRILSSRVLIAMRGNYFEEVADPVPWYEGYLLLSPHCIKKAFQLVSDEDIESSPTSSSSSLLKSTKSAQNLLKSPKSAQNLNASFDLNPISVFEHDFNLNKYNNYNQEMSDNNNDHINGIELLSKLNHSIEPIYTVEIKKVRDLIIRMEKIRKKCDILGLVPLYHYTIPQLASVIIRDGFEMKINGKTENGIYFNTKSPISFDIYNMEENIIIEYFGKEKLFEYKGKHLFDLVFVYGIEPLLIESVPNQSENIKMISKNCFKDFGLPQKDGHYYLRPDFLFGVFLIDSDHPPTLQSSSTVPSSISPSSSSSRSPRSLSSSSSSSRSALMNESMSSMNELLNREKEADAKVLSKLTALSLEGQKLHQESTHVDYRECLFPGHDDDAPPPQPTSTDTSSPLVENITKSDAPRKSKMTSSSLSSSFSFRPKKRDSNGSKIKDIPLGSHI